MSKKIRVGLVGCGGIATSAHIPALLEIEEVEVVAVCDIIKERAEKAAKTLGAKYIFTDYKDLIALDDIDVVDICTPNYLHSEVTIAAFNAGKHVFCEKPDAISVEKVLEMKAASEKANKKLMVMRNNRYTAAATYAKQYIKDENADFYAGRCGWLRRRGIPGKGGWFTTKAQSGGGPLIDLGVHMIDLAVWLMGSPKPVAVSGSVYNKFADNTADADSAHAGFGDATQGGTFDVEDLAMGMIRFDNGAVLQIECSWASNVEKEHTFVELRGSTAGIRLVDGNLTIYTEKHGSITDINPVLNHSVNGHTANLKHFFQDVIINDKEPIFKPMEGVNMIKILDAIYRSAEAGMEIKL